MDVSLYEDMLSHPIHVTSLLVCESLVPGAWCCKVASLRPMSIVPFFENTPLIRQSPLKLGVLCRKTIVKAKKSAVSFLSNCSLTCSCLEGQNQPPLF